MINASPVDAPSDFAHSRLGDVRLERRLTAISRRLQLQPSASFPKAMGGDAATEGFYRFMANDKVEWASLLRSHAEATQARALEAGTVLAIHDSSLCQFGGEEIREGAFRTAKGKSGFLAHTCLAVSADGTRRPLGVLGMTPVVRCLVPPNSPSPVPANLPGS